MQEKITIINTILILFLIIKPYLKNIEFKIRRTFWEKKPFGFSVYIYDLPRGSRTRTGTRLFGFNWRKEKNIKDESIHAKMKQLRKEKL